MITETHVFGDFKMKNVILSAGGPMRVYSVPDKIADNLEGMCWYFRSIWLYDGPEATGLLSMVLPDTMTKILLTI